MPDSAQPAHALIARLHTFGGLWVERGTAAASGGPRPRPLALLAILAAAGPQGASRDRVLGVLWPESAPDRARHALSQTLYNLRRDLGDDVVISSQTLQLDSTRISTDVAEFQEAMRSRDWAAAATLYTGPFLDGFYLNDAPEFERWTESERASFVVDGMRAIEAVAMECSAHALLGETVKQWRRLTLLDPANARFAASYMEALAANGDRTAALTHGKSFVELMQREYETDADPDVQRLLYQLRDVKIVPPAPVLPRVAVNGSPSIESPTRGDMDGMTAAPRFKSRSILAAGILCAAVVGAVGWRASSHPLRPVLAVGRIRDFTLLPGDSTSPTAVSNAMLATSLGRLSELQVVASSRMLELTPQGGETSRIAVTDAARRAGATELIEGEIVPLAGDRVRLDLRRVAIDKGLIVRAYRIVGSDRIALFDSATVLITSDLGVRAPNGSLAEVSTRSPIAFRLFEEGVRRFAQSDTTAAALFRDAVREDSSFAVAQYYLWQATNQLTDAERALKLADRASERDRLLIRAHIRSAYNDLGAIGAAESLATRFPADPEVLARAAAIVPDLARAAALANRSIALDSAAGATTGTLCRVCNALAMMATRYEWADSLSMAEKTVRRWISFRPHDFQPWGTLADYLISLDRLAEADSAWSRAIELGQPRGVDFERRIVSDLREDRPAHADSTCKAALPTSDARRFQSLGWYCAIGLRMQGRYREALELVRDGRVPGSQRIRRSVRGDALMLAVLQMETGDARSASYEFQRVAALEAAGGAPEPLRARRRVWNLTLAATAAVEGGDTSRAIGFIDSVEAIGRRSMYARDPLLHHFIRGVVFARAHRDALAERELRASIWSPTNGYTRANYELGLCLLRLHRASEGIPVVRAALHGGIEGSGLYVTRTEMHELLARLFDAAGARDSAAVHYAVVARAWRSADPALKARYEVAQRYGRR